MSDAPRSRLARPELQSSTPATLRDFGPRVHEIPEGDSRERLICPDCGFINYENPKVVVGAVIVHDDRILMCRRAIHPRRGYWTIPAGYLELGESTAAGARREAREEACAEIEIEGLLGLYSIPRISQVQLIYRARMATPHFAAGEESEAAELYRWDDIPWTDIAFPSVHWALGHYLETKGQAVFAPRGNPPGLPGAD